MLARAQDRVVLEQSVQHVERFARRTGDGAGAEHAVVVGGVGIKRDGPLVIAEVPRVERGQQGTACTPKR